MIERLEERAGIPGNQFPTGCRGNIIELHRRGLSLTGAGLSSPGFEALSRVWLQIVIRVTLCEADMVRTDRRDKMTFMCHFVTAFLFGNKDPEAAKLFLKSSGFAFDILRNPFLMSQVQGEAVYFRPTKGICDCGTVLGSLFQHPKDEERKQRTLAGKIKRFRKKGWSESKIETWQRDIERKVKNIKATAESKPVSAKRWVDFIMNTLISGHAESVGLLLHWYSGALETERIDLHRTERCAAENVNDDFLLHIEPDVLYVFSIRTVLYKAKKCR